MACDLEVRMLFLHFDRIQCTHCSGTNVKSQ
jgi:hypothetical protein